MYSKNGGKAGAHTAVTTAESIGSLSYICAQIFEYSGRRKIFHTVHQKYAMAVGVGLRRYSHFPSHAFLVLVADSDISKTTNGLSVSTSAWKIFNDFSDQREAIRKAVANLIKQCQGNTSKSLENEEDDADINH